MEKLRILLAGIGGYGMGYLDELLDTADDTIELAGVADPFAGNSPRLGDLKSRSIPVYKNSKEFYAENRADLAVISSPIHTHYPYVLSCHKNGSHVLCEKPVTGNIKEFDELAADEKKTGLFTAVGFQLCFSRDVQALKQDILAGLFGKPLKFKALNLPRRGTVYYRRNNWVGKLKSEGSVILDSPLQNACAHELLNMLFLLGDDMNRSAGVESLTAELWQGRPEIENYDAAAVRLVTKPSAVGAVVPVCFYTAHCIKEANTGPMGEFLFENALIKREAPGPNYTAYFNNGTVKRYGEIDKGKPLQKLYDTVEAIRKGVSPVCTLETVRPHLECVELVQKYPIKKVPREKLGEASSEDGDTFYYVPGLRKTFLSAYEKSALPLELPVETV